MSAWPGGLSLGEIKQQFRERMSDARTAPAELLRVMLRIRRFEEHVIQLTDRIWGTYHVAIGQEAAAVGACSVLESNDVVFTTHRNHAHILAKGGDTARLLAEILGRVDGYCQGRSGSFHVVAPEIGVVHSSAIVGGILPVAAGASYAAQVRNTGQVTVVFFGDGAMEEGAAYETLNIAALWKLPIIFLMENNGRAPFNRVSGNDVERLRPWSSAGLSAVELADVPRALGIPTRIVDGRHVTCVAEALRSLVGPAREGQGPFFVEARTPRWPGNDTSIPRLIGGALQVAWAWQPESAPEVVRDWAREHDPVLLHAQILLREHALSRRALLELDRKVQAEMALAVEFALASKIPRAESAVDHVFA